MLASGHNQLGAFCGQILWRSSLSLQLSVREWRLAKCPTLNWFASPLKAKVEEITRRRWSIQCALLHRSQAHQWQQTDRKMATKLLSASSAERNRKGKDESSNWRQCVLLTLKMLMPRMAPSDNYTTDDPFYMHLSSLNGLTRWFRRHYLQLHNSNSYHSSSRLFSK